MSYNNIVPAWLAFMPDVETDREAYIEYLNDLSNGVPKHVRERLLTLLEEDGTIR